MLRCHQTICCYFFFSLVAYNCIPSGLREDKKKKPENYFVKITIPLARKKNENEFHGIVFIHAIHGNIELHCI